MSYGIVAADECASLELAVRLADDALYEAKALGRDRSVIADSQTVPAGAATVIRVAEPVRSRSEGVLARLATEDDPVDH